MSDASQIPNLLSLRGRGGGRRGRGRGGAQTPGETRQDTAIQGTDNDAAVSRLSAVDVGYLDDPYAQFFVQSMGAPTRRLPIINRGTYTRTSAIDTLVNAFLGSQASDTRQIVSLGGGTDTRPYRIFSRRNIPKLIYHEVDFEIVTKKKQRITQGNPALSRILPNITTSEDDASWRSHLPSGSEYYCHGIDLRKLPSAGDGLPLKGLRLDVPTLVLSECCLCYLTPEDASSILDIFTKRIPDVATIIYEPIRANDSFGKVMTSNLANRGIHMPTLREYQTPGDQEARLQQAGFVVSRAFTVKDIWKNWIPGDEKLRVDSLEGLDEVEEWELLADHYVVVWALRESEGGSIRETDQALSHSIWGMDAGTPR